MDVMALSLDIEQPFTQRSVKTRSRRSKIRNPNIFGPDFQTEECSQVPSTTEKIGINNRKSTQTSQKTLPVQRKKENKQKINLINAAMEEEGVTFSNDSHYVPEVIDEIFREDLLQISSSSNYLYVSLTNVDLNSLPSHWKAIHDFDLKLVFGKHDVHTFKKLHNFSAQLQRVLDQISAEAVKYSPESDTPDPSRFDLALKLWAIFPPMFLRIGKYKSVNSIKTRLRQFRTGDWQCLVKDLILDLKNPTLIRTNKKYKGVTNIEDTTAQTRYSKAAKILHEDGDISKAFQAIVNPVQSSPVSMESIETLRSLHPKRLIENEFTYQQNSSLLNIPDMCNPKLLWQYIRSSKSGKASGVDGLRMEHLKSMARCGTAPWLTSMSSLVNLAIRGNLPSWLISLLTSSRLIGLHKPREEGEKLKLRPIGIGVVWLKLISKTALRFHHQNILAYLEPFQFGLSSSGLESISQIIQQTLKENPSYILFRGDIKNAFNSLLRKTIFKEINEQFPLLLPWVNCLYGSFSNLWTKSTDGSYFAIDSEEGVKQGETLGSALFNIGIHTAIVKRLNKILNPGGGVTYGCVIAFHDDINFLVNPKAFSEVDLWNEFLHGLTECGLQINMSKSKILMPLTIDNNNSEYISSLPEGITTRTDGVEFAGTPIGTSPFCLQFWESNLIKEISEAIPLVCAWPDVQAALCLYRLCICSKFNYFLRLTDPNADYSEVLVDKLHRLVQLGLSFLVDVTTRKDSFTEINDDVWDQSTLPPKRGGLGIQDPRRNHTPAYLATFIAGSFSKLHLEDALRKINDSEIQSPDSQRTDIPLHELFKFNIRDNDAIQRLFSKFIINFRLEKQAPTLEDIASHAKPQSYLASFLHDSIDRKIRSTWPSESITRLDSCCYEGGVLITALPTKTDFSILANHQFRERLQMRLGLTIKGVDPGPCVECRGSVDSKGYHLLSVCNCGNERQSTHNALRDAVISLCKHAGLITRPEDSSLNKLVDENTKKKTDFTCDNFLPGVPITFDASVTDPRQFVPVNPQPGKAAQTREKEKIKKYENDMHKSGSIFRPFVLESFGRWGPITRVIFTELIARVMQTTQTYSLPISKDLVTHYWRSRITMAMHRQACLGMHQRIQRRLKKKNFAHQHSNTSMKSSNSSPQQLIPSASVEPSSFLACSTGSQLFPPDSSNLLSLIKSPEMKSSSSSISCSKASAKYKQIKLSARN